MIIHFFFCSQFDLSGIIREYENLTFHSQVRVLHLAMVMFLSTVYYESKLRVFNLLCLFYIFPVRFRQCHDAQGSERKQITCSRQ